MSNQSNPIGVVETINGKVTALSPKEGKRDLAAGDKVYEQELIETCDSNALIKLNDGTLLKVPENQEVRLYLDHGNKNLQEGEDPSYIVQPNQDCDDVDEQKGNYSFDVHHVAPSDARGNVFAVGETEGLPPREIAKPEETQTPTGEVSLDKSVDNKAPDIGDEITYTIKVLNEGPGIAKGIEVTESLPSIQGLEYQIHGVSHGTYDPNTGFWDLGNLDNGEVATLTITVVVNDMVALENVVNTAEITNVDTLDQNEENNKDQEIIDPQDADLKVEKTADVSEACLGDTVNFKISLMNLGNDTALNVVLNDLLPEGFDFVNATPDIGMYNPETGIWTVGELGPNETVCLVIETVVGDDMGMQQVYPPASNAVAYEGDGDYEQCDDYNQYAYGEGEYNGDYEGDYEGDYKDECNGHEEPQEPMVITNTASAESTTYDPNLNNNSDDAMVTILPTIVLNPAWVIDGVKLVNEGDGALYVVGHGLNPSDIPDGVVLCIDINIVFGMGMGQAGADDFQNMFLADLANAIDMNPGVTLSGNTLMFDNTGPSNVNFLLNTKLDQLLEGNEDYTIQLSNPSHKDLPDCVKVVNLIDQGTVETTIVDVPPIEINPFWCIYGDEKVVEGNSAQYFIAAGFNPNTMPDGMTVCIDIAIELLGGAGNAEAADFTQAFLAELSTQLPAGVTLDGNTLIYDNNAPWTFGFNLETLDDAIFEGNEDFSITISNPTEKDVPGNVIVNQQVFPDTVETTICENDCLELLINEICVEQGGGAVSFIEFMSTSVNSQELSGMVINFDGVSSATTQIFNPVANSGDTKIPAGGFLVIRDTGVYEIYDNANTLVGQGQSNIDWVFEDSNSDGFVDTRDQIGIQVESNGKISDTFLANGASIANSKWIPNSFSPLGLFDTFNGQIGNQAGVLDWINQFPSVNLPRPDLDGHIPSVGDSNMVFARVSTTDTNTEADWTTSDMPPSDGFINNLGAVNLQDPLDNINPEQHLGIADSGQTIINLEGAGDNAQGGRGPDFIFGNDKNNVLKGEEHNDALYGGEGLDRLEGGSGADVLVDFEGENNELWGPQDTLIGGSGKDILIARNPLHEEDHDKKDEYDDERECPCAVSPNITGDVLIGDNVITADQTESNQNTHDDIIFGGNKSDFIFGDTLKLEPGKTLPDFYANPYALALAVGFSLDPQIMTDLMVVLHSIGDGDDDIAGGDGNDSIFGQGGNDEILGEGGADDIFGGDGNDYISGGDGYDILWGNDGDDVIWGDECHDDIYGGKGNDELHGGDGADSFLWKADDIGTAASPDMDTIKDLALNSDQVSLSEILSGVADDSASGLDSGGYVEISFDGGDGDDVRIKIDVDGSGGGDPFSHHLEVVLEGIEAGDLGNPVDNQAAIQALIDNNVVF